MKKTFIYPLLMSALLLSSVYTSCTSSEDEDIYIVKDTVVINVDTLIKEKRNTEKLNLTFVIQLAAFKEQKYAEPFLEKAKEKLNTVPDMRKSGGVFLITIGKFNDASSAQDYLNFVKSRGYPNAFIKSID